MINCGCFSVKTQKKNKCMMRIGVLCIDYEYPPIVGDVDCNDTFEHDMVYEKVNGLTFERAQQGYWDKHIELNVKIALRRLETTGCIGITSDCGFMMAYQVRIRRLTTLPVFTSSLLQAPIVESMFQREEQIMIITANEKALKENITYLFTNCGIYIQDINRFVIIGCDTLPSFQSVSTGNERINYKTFSKELMEYLVMRLTEYPDVKGFILECTELPAYGDLIRKQTHLPVFDAVTMINYYFASMSDNKLFGIPQWYL